MSGEFYNILRILYYSGKCYYEIGFLKIKSLAINSNNNRS